MKELSIFEKRKQELEKEIQKCMKTQCRCCYDRSIKINEIQKLQKEILTLKLGKPKIDMYLFNAVLNKKDANLIVIGNNRVIDIIAGRKK